MNRRKNYYIKEEFQSWFIIRCCLLAVAACLGFGLLMYVVSIGSTTTAFEKSRFVIKSTADYLLPFLVLCGSLTMIGISLAAVYLIKRVSHRLAGPLFCLERHAKQVSDGNLVYRTYLRDTDQLKETALSLNDMSQTLAERLEHIQNKIEEIEKSGFVQEPLKSHFLELKKQVEFFETRKEL